MDKNTQTNPSTKERTASTEIKSYLDNLGVDKICQRY